MRNIFICCIFSVFLLLLGCTRDPFSNIEETKNTTDADSLTETTIASIETIADLQTINHVASDDQSLVQLSDDEKDYINSLLKIGKWEEELIKMSGDYTFTLENDVTLSYASDIGAINDTTHNRHLELTDEQKNALNEFLKP